MKNTSNTNLLFDMLFEKCMLVSYQPGLIFLHQILGIEKKIPTYTGKLIVQSVDRLWLQCVPIPASGLE